jgi:hypothetical protein
MIHLHTIIEAIEETPP